MVQLPRGAHLACLTHSGRTDNYLLRLHVMGIQNVSWVTQCDLQDNIGSCMLSGPNHLRLPMLPAQLIPMPSCGNRCGCLADSPSPGLVHIQSSAKPLVPYPVGISAQPSQDRRRSRFGDESHAASAMAMTPHPIKHVQDSPQVQRYCCQLALRHYSYLLTGD